MSEPDIGRHSRRIPHAVSATQLAEMGHCEQRVVLAHLYGERTTVQQRQARRRGLRLHEQYLAQGKAAASDGRCFVSSCLFGPMAPETQTLRAFRDFALLPHAWGRLLLTGYYAVAPTVCVLLRRSPMCARLIRGILQVALALYRRASAIKERS